MRNGGAAALCVVGMGLAACGSEGTSDVLLRTALVTQEGIDFGEVRLGERESATLALENAGDTTLTIVRVEGSGGAFAVGRVTLPLEILPLQVAHVPLTFAPTTRGRADASVTIETMAPSPILREVELTGVGTIETVEIQPEFFAFGYVVSGEQESQPLTIVNRGDTAVFDFLLESEVRACDPNRAATVCVDTGGAPLAVDPGETKSFDVVFRARELGDVSRTLALETLGGQRFQLGISGFVVDNRLLCDEPEELGAVNLGRCGIFTIACENVSVSQLTIVSASAQSTETDGFSVASPTRPRVLDPSQSIDVDVEFCPTDAGRFEATLSIDTDQMEPERRSIAIELVAWGGGPDLVVSPLRLDFGQVSTVAPATRDVLVSNVGTSMMWISTATISAPFTARFFGPRLQSGETARVPVTFAPTAAGVVQGKLRFESNDPDTPLVEVDLVGEGVVLSPCQYAVTGTVAFGEVDVFRTLRRAVEIENVGADRCLVSGARIVAGSDVFAATDDVRNLFIAPGEVTTLAVEMTPKARGQLRGELSIAISSASSSDIPLTGSGASTGLLIAPDEVTFGAVDGTCVGTTRTVRIHNPGTLVATIDAMRIAPHAAFSIATLPPGLEQGPIALAPDGMVELEVRFVPGAAAASYGAAVEILGSFGGVPYQRLVALEGRAGANVRQVDRFTQGRSGKADVLFVVDGSGSLTEELASLAANVGVLQQFAQALGIDYQIGVTTMDLDAVHGRLVHEPAHFDGPLENRIVTPRSPAPWATLATNLEVGSIDTGPERGMENGYLALTSANTMGPNAGFLRADASLAVVYVADQDDQSARPLLLYTDALLMTKQDPNLVTVSAITGDTPAGCVGPGGPANAGTAYAALVDRVGGAFESICAADLGLALLEITQPSFGYRRSLTLSSMPEMGSFVVRVDGTTVPATGTGGTMNWTYDAVNRRVRFTPFAVPEPGAEVEVEYAVACP